MRAFRTLTGLGLAAAAVLVTSSATAAPATAATKSDAAGVCGPAYWPLDQYKLDHATVYLSYDGGHDCVVTWADPGYEGTLRHLGAFVGTSLPTTSNDVHDYEHYAGPVKVFAPGQCIYWGGEDLDAGAVDPDVVNAAQDAVNAVDGGPSLVGQEVWPVGTYYLSNAVHCG